MLRALELKPHTIWLLTDGEFPDDICDKLKTANPEQKVSINTIAFHDPSGEAVMKRIAKENAGDYRFVPAPIGVPAQPPATPNHRKVASVAPTINAVLRPGWTQDYAKAVEKAKAEKKNILLDFTGSDWCGFCKTLDKEVFQTPKFQSWARQNVILVEVDFPKNVRQSDKIKQQNADLKTKYPFGGYPTIVITDADGKELARKSGYHPGSGPVAYIADLDGTLKKASANP